MAPCASRLRPPAHDLVPPPRPLLHLPHARSSPEPPLTPWAPRRQRHSTEGGRGRGQCRGAAGGGVGQDGAPRCCAAQPAPSRGSCGAPITPQPWGRELGALGPCWEPRTHRGEVLQDGGGAGGQVSPAAPAPQPSSARPCATLTFLVARAGSCCRRWLRTGRSPPAAPCSHSFSTGSSCRRPSAPLPGAPGEPQARPSTHGHGAGAHAAAPILGCLLGVLLAVLLARLRLWVRAVPAHGALAQAQQGLGEGPRGRPPAPAWPWERGEPQGQPQGQPGHSPHSPAPACGVPAALLPLLTAALKSVTRIWGGAAPRASAPAGEPWHRATVSGAATLGGRPTSAPCPRHSARLGLRGRAQGQQQAGGSAAPAPLPRGRPAPRSVTLQPSPCSLLGPGPSLGAGRPHCAPSPELGNG